MKFSELEQFMNKRGINSLAEISRLLNTTPQAVSNWKARDQVPYHIISKLEKLNSPQVEASSFSATNARNRSPSLYIEESLSLSDLFLTIAEQLKVILLVFIITVFITVTYVQFIKIPVYISSATILLPENKGVNLGGLAGLVSTFGVNVPTGIQADLSSPSLFPELVRSRTFAEKILDKEFYSKKYGKTLTLLAILTYGDKTPNVGKDTLVTNALGTLRSMIAFDKGPSNIFSIIRVSASDPVLAKKLADVVLSELEKLNRYFKSKTVNEKTGFIENRIFSVESDLEKSEQILKTFKQQNRQISSPSLELQEDKLTRNVEVQKGIYLTLKQQLELSKIEEVQETSILQILDKPQVPLAPSNKNLKISVLLASILGIGLGIFFGFIRAYLNSPDIDQRKKMRRVKNFIKKKSKDFIMDRRIAGIISVVLILGLPYYFGTYSDNPVFFGMYSTKLMITNTLYILVLLFSISLFIYLTRKKT